MKIKYYRTDKKPCHVLKYCPYGPLVEEMPLLDNYDEKSGEQRCSVFGHQCPYYYCAEGAVDNGENIWQGLNEEIKGFKARRGL